MPTSSSQNFDNIVAKVKKSQEIYANFTQEQVDQIVFKAAIAANHARISLAKMATEETGMGITEDKVIKNHFAAEFVYNKYRNTKTCGIVEHDNFWGIYKIADSMGIVAAVIPCTNPTSTVIFKSLLALKTRNGIIISPHPKAKKCSYEAAKIILNAAIEAGAPKDIIACIENPTIELTQQLMQHKDTAVILATGGPGLVKAAYSSGKPAIGVGPGNTPAVVDETANIKMTVSSIILSKTFDNGVICASEQSIVAVNSIYADLKKELVLQGAYILKKEEKAKLAKVLIIDGRLNPSIVGQSALKIAQIAGFKVPENVKVLIGEAGEVSKKEAFSYEKLSPVLGLYKAKDFHSAVDIAEKLIEFGGLGHTSVLYTNEANTDRIKYFGERMKTVRVLVNIPSSQGAIGDVYNFHLEPSLTLGCGTYGGNIISGNIGVKHLLNIKTIAERRENMLWFRVPPQIYFNSGCLPVALESLKNYERAFIVTEQNLCDKGYVDPIIEILKSKRIQYKIFSEITIDPTLELIKRGVESVNDFKPDIIFALGCGSSMDAAKVIRLMHDCPEIDLKDLAMRFMNIKKRIYKLEEKTDNKITLVAIPTTSGTGSEVTPFAVVSDTKENVKYPIVDYSIAPDMVILEPNFVLEIPKDLTASDGFDAISHAVEAIASIMATDYSNAMAIKALRVLFEYLPIAYKEGSKNPKAREKVHYASAMAGMAFANAYLGVCHSMTHKLESSFEIAHGVANAILLPHVIRYNATVLPSKLVAFSQYKTPRAAEDYANAVDEIGLSAKNKTQKEKVNIFIKALEDMRKKLNMPSTLKEAGIAEKDFMQKVDELAELAFDDQCTGTNPRYPLIKEIKEIYLKAYK